MNISNPSKQDWASTCHEDLRKLEIKSSHQEIQTRFTDLNKEKIREKVLNYLKEKQSKKKGKN